MPNYRYTDINGKSQDWTTEDAMLAAANLRCATGATWPNPSAVEVGQLWQHSQRCPVCVVEIYDSQIVRFSDNYSVLSGALIAGKDGWRCVGLRAGGGERVMVGDRYERATYAYSVASVRGGQMLEMCSSMGPMWDYYVPLPVLLGEADGWRRLPAGKAPVQPIRAAGHILAGEMVALVNQRTVARAFDAAANTATITGGMQQEWAGTWQVYEPAPTVVSTTGKEWEAPARRLEERWPDEFGPRAAANGKAQKVVPPPYQPTPDDKHRWASLRRLSRRLADMPAVGVVARRRLSRQLTRLAEAVEEAPHRLSEMAVDELWAEVYMLMGALAVLAEREGQLTEEEERDDMAEVDVQVDVVVGRVRGNG